VPLLDAVLLIGGPDIDPSLYGEQPHPLTAPAGGGRDESEIELVRAAIEHDVPTLAICRGLEVLNVTLGGSLTQHLPDVVGHDAHQPDPNAFTRHDVEAIFPGSTERETYSVPSFHHQAINRLAPELEPWAWASDGTVEAARHRTATWVHGVQWHPEVGDDLHIIDTFITAMAQRRTEKLESAR
jgi:gamma-glutamyl-gamma-aminobutyrate hydrolase PuuD